MLFLLILLISGCDLFWGMPWGKSSRDPSSQIGVVRAVNVGDNSIALAWDWRPFFFGDPNREIVELRIMHGPGSPPAFIPPLPFGEAYTDRLAPAGWFKIVEDLQNDREYYFSIYGKEKSGEWVGPWTVSLNTGRSDGPVTSGPWDPIGGWEIDNVNGSVGPIVNGLDADHARVYQYDTARFGEVGFVDSAQSVDITGFTLESAGTIVFYPLRWNWDPGAADSYETLMDTPLTRDDAGAVYKTLLGGETGITLLPEEVRKILNRMRMFDNGLLYIEATGGAGVGSFSPPEFSEITYWRW